MKSNSSNGSYLWIDENSNMFRVDRRAFVSEEAFAAERREIFDKCWLYLGHESELERKGSYLARSVGGRNLLFNRDGEGVVHAFLNSCPHRGSQVCREKSGVTKTFQCFYHGWVFGTDGTFKRQHDHQAYADSFNSDGGANLVPVPRLDQYRGFWFVCFDKNSISLHDYLGNAREYIDCVADQSGEALQIISGAQEYKIRANWKLLCENSIDGFHADSTHATYFDYVKNINPNAGKMKLEGVSRDLGNGHAVVEYRAPWGRPVAKWSQAWGEHTKAEVEGLYQKMKERIGKEKADRVAFQNRNIVIFPNLVIVDGVAIVVRTMFPDTPDEMQVNTWAIAPKEESNWQRQLRLSNFLEFLGPGGLATPDDIEALEHCQRGYKNISEARWNDISKGAIGASELPMEDEGQIRAFWREWDRRMVAAGKYA